MSRWGVFALLWSGAVSALQPADLRGLRLETERFDTPVRVEGVALHVQRVHGADVLQLVQRVEARWRAHADPVQQHSAGAWQILSRRTPTRSETIQWRLHGSESELLYSWLDPGATITPAQRTAPQLPGCTWGGHSSSETPQGGFRQWTAICAATSAVNAPALTRHFVRAGWQPLRQTADLLALRRHGSDAVLIRTLPPAAGQSAYIWLETWTRNEGSRP